VIRHLWAGATRGLLLGLIVGLAAGLVEGIAMLTAASGARASLVEAAVYALVIDGLAGAGLSAMVGLIMAALVLWLRPTLGARRLAALHVSVAAASVLLVVGALWSFRAHGASREIGMPTATVISIVMLAVLAGAVLYVPARGFAPVLLSSVKRTAFAGIVGFVCLALVFPAQVLIEARQHARAAGVAGPEVVTVDLESLGDGLWHELDRALAAPRATGSSPTQQNVLLITVDALRADHLGACGNDWIVTPWVDLLARHSATFCMAYPQQPQTNPSLASLFTSTYPAVHGVRVHMVDRLPDSFDTLAEILQRAGFTTAAVIPWTSLEPAFSGFHQGFNTYEAFVENEPEALKNPATAALAGIYRRVTDQIAVGSAVESVLGMRQGTEAQIDGRADISAAATVNWLANHPNSRFFLWVHFFDPHYPWTPPEPWDGLYDQGYAGRYDGSMNFIYEMREGVFTPDARDVEYLRALYASEVSYADHYIGQVLGYMAQEGILDNTIVVLTADHGEALGERGNAWPNGDSWLHGDDLYEPGTRMPLIIHNPRSRSAQPVPQVPVQAVDVMPTVLELLGLPIPTQAQGKSLVSVIDGSDTGTDRTAVVTLTDDAVTAIVAADGWKLHMSRQTGARELYYLPADPGERNDLSRSYPAQVNALVARLDAWAQANQIRLIAGNDRDQPRGGGG
jgi:arylsulfatase A-like enzyme